MNIETRRSLPLRKENSNAMNLRDLMPNDFRRLISTMPSLFLRTKKNWVLTVVRVMFIIEIHHFCE